jgi:predicted negative regulator of RcsB-dependent stress response
MGAPRAIALCQSFNGALEFQVGHWPEAEESLHESIELFRQIGAADGEALSYQRLGILLTAQGKLDEGLAALEEGVVAAKHAKLRAHLQGRLYAAVSRNRLLAGDLAAADHALSLGQALTESHGHCALCEALLLPVAVSVRIAQGDLDGAEAYCRHLEEATARYGSHTWVALAAQARGELAAAQGEIEAAIAHFTEARSSFQEARNEYAVTQCTEALARLHEQE